MTLRVSHVRISNILGISELEFSPPGFTEVVGSNGSGKTSTIEALRAALRGGHDATLLRKGAEKGEIVLVLDDGTQIKKRVTADGTSVDVIRDGKKLSRPAEAIKALHDVLSVNPVEFLRAPEKERVNALMQAMPINVDRAHLQSLIRADFVTVPASGDSGLSVIESLKKQVFDERTSVNRAARDKEGTINQMRATLPDELPDSPPTDASLIEKLNTIDAERDAELERIRNKLAGIKSESDARIASLKGQIDAQIAALQSQIESEKQGFEAIRQKAAAKEQECRTKHAADRAGIEAIVNSIEDAQKQHARYQQTKEVIQKMICEHAMLKRDSEELTDSLDALEAYKSELLASLPISGLAVIDGRVFRNGIEFDRLNTAQQVEIAVEIAKLRAGELGLICVDGLELLDHEAYDAFRVHAATSGLQMIVSRVGDGPLKINGGE